MTLCCSREPESSSQNLCEVASQDYLTPAPWGLCTTSLRPLITWAFFSETQHGEPCYSSAKALSQLF